MIILGIDPGIAIVGYGVLNYTGNKFKVLDYGAVTTSAKSPLPERLKIVFEDLNRVIAAHRPEVMAIEELFFNNNAKTAFAVGQGRGVAILTAANRGIPVFEYTPLQVKQATTGYGRADKNQVQQMVKSILCLNAIPKPDDVADALAIAICHAHSAAFNASVGGK